MLILPFFCRKCKFIFVPQPKKRAKRKQGDHKLSPILLSFPTCRLFWPNKNSENWINKWFSLLSHICWMFHKIFIHIIFFPSKFLSRAKFVPDFQPTEEVAQPALSTHPNVPPDEKFSPPTPEEAERIISHLLPWWDLAINYIFPSENHSNFLFSELWFPYQSTRFSLSPFPFYFRTVFINFYDVTHRRRWGKLCNCRMLYRPGKRRISFNFVSCRL